MMRFKFVGIPAVLAAAAAFGVLAPVALAGKLDYKVTFHIAKGSYGSTQTSSLGSTSESDNFEATAHYQMEIPKTGNVPAIKRASKNEDFAPDASGTPAWQITGGGGNCTGDLYSDPTLPPVLEGREANGAIAFQVAAADNVLVEHLHGQVGTIGSCQEYYGKGVEAFNPAWRDFMPGMLTARLDPVKVKALRGLKVGKAIAVPVTATDNAQKHPRRNCSTSDVQCTQQMGWRGEVKFERES
jgi:hypothetical protein